MQEEIKFNSRYGLSFVAGKQLIIIASFMMLFSSNIFANIKIEVIYSESPLEITLNWNSQGTGKAVQVFRRQLGEEGSATWISQAIVSDPTLKYTDSSISLGVSYEYRLLNVDDRNTQGYVSAGLNLDMVEDRGAMLLVVEKSIVSSLTVELARFEQDLRGDGWKVIRHDSDRHGAGTPEDLKTWIQAQYNAAPSEIKALLLFGHLPICMSGYSAPDGHNSQPLPTDLFMLILMEDGRMPH